MDYSDYLKNPLWIRKRKRIILRDDKQCTVCSAKKNLQVHHTFYYTDYREPWRYPDGSLITVCESCHKEYHEHHEHEFKKPPKIVVKKKFKPRRKQKMKNSKVVYHRQPKMCLAVSQAIRLGYSRNSLGQWVKDQG